MPSSIRFKITSALQYCPQAPVTLSIRGWAHMIGGNLTASLRDCLAVLENAESVSYTDHSYLAAIVNAATALSYEAGVYVQAAVLSRLQDAISQYRKSLPKSGSNYYKTQSLRLVLSRGEALVLARLGKKDRAIAILERVVTGLSTKFPDDALNASVDLMCLHAKFENETAAAKEARRSLALAEAAKVRPIYSAMSVLKASAQQDSLTPMQVAELRIRLRSREQPVSAWRQVQAI